MFKWHFLNFSVCPSPLVLSLDITENLALSLHPPIRCLYTWIKSPSLGWLLPAIQRRPHLLYPSLFPSLPFSCQSGKCSPLHQLHCSAPWEWPSSSQLIHHPSQSRVPTILLPLSCKVQNPAVDPHCPPLSFLFLFFPPVCPGRSSLSAATFDSQRRPHCHGSQILIADHSCCPRDSVHSFSGPPHLRIKQKTKIWVTYAQPKLAKPSGNTCYAPGFLDWITGAHLEGDNCPVDGQTSAVSLQHPRTEPLVGRKHPKTGQAERWGLKFTQEGVTCNYQPLLSASDPSLDRAPSPSSTSRSCSRAAGGTGAFLQRPEVTSFWVCHQGNLHFPHWLAQTPSTSFSTVGSASFLHLQDFGEEPITLSGPALNQLLYPVAVL